MLGRRGAGGRDSAAAEFVDCADARQLDPRMIAMAANLKANREN
jgi:hypothetical protein